MASTRIHGAASRSSGGDTARAGVESTTVMDLAARMVIELLRDGQPARFVARGGSMWPAVRDGSVIEVTPCPADQLRPGELGAFVGAHGPVDAPKRRPWLDWLHSGRDLGSLVRGYVKWDDEPASPQAAAESLLRARMI